MITYSFSGTSHGKGYCGTVGGLPQGFVIDVDAVNRQLALRKCGYGRSARQQNADVVTFDGQNGSTVTVSGDLNFFVANASANVESRPEITALRSGHADVVGLARYPNLSTREVAEIASARSSLCYVVVGAICKQLLAKQGIFTYSYVKSIGNVKTNAKFVFGKTDKQKHFEIFHCPSKSATQKMMQAVDEARAQGNSLGGVVTVGATGVPMGLGDVFPYENRFDGVVAGALMSIPSVKAVEFGIGTTYATANGVSSADVLTTNGNKIVYATNNAGGVVAGVTNGQDVVCSLTVKPVPTVKGVTTVDKITHQTVPMHYERADTSVVQNVGVIAENVLATLIANLLIKQNLL